MTISEKSPKKNLQQMELKLQTSSRVAYRANRSRSQANKKERVTIDISGQRCFALSRHSNQNSLLSRMCEELLTSKTAWSSKLCALTWKVKDTKSKRSIFQLQVSALPTEEKESGSSQLWATPNTMDHLPTRSEEGTRKLMNGQRKGRTAPSNLREQVDPKTMKLWRTPDAHCDRGASSSTRMKMKLEKKMPISINDQVAHPNLMWPTPTQDSATERTKKYKQGGTPLTLAVQKWPTPTARDWKDSGKAVVNSTRNLLPQAVAKRDKETWIKGGGALNPTWVEWLMGYPAEYTDLKHWEILSSRKSSKK